MVGFLIICLILFGVKRDKNLKQLESNILQRNKKYGGSGGNAVDDDEQRQDFLLIQFHSKPGAEGETESSGDNNNNGLGVGTLFLRRT